MCCDVCLKTLIGHSLLRIVRLNDHLHEDAICMMSWVITKSIMIGGNDVAAEH
jgi:hypothetical protein